MGTPARPPTYCPYCDSSKIAQVPRINGDKRVTWLKCFDCGRLFSVPQLEPVPIK